MMVEKKFPCGFLSSAGGKVWFFQYNTIQKKWRERGITIHLYTAQEVNRGNRAHLYLLQDHSQRSRDRVAGPAHHQHGPGVLVSIMHSIQFNSFSCHSIPSSSATTNDDNKKNNRRSSVGLIYVCINLQRLQPPAVRHRRRQRGLEQSGLQPVRSDKGTYVYFFNV